MGLLRPMAADMKAGENMKKLLARSGVYKLTGDTPLEWELAAYDAGFSLLEEALSRTEEGIFARSGWTNGKPGISPSRCRRILQPAGRC